MSDDIQNTKKPTLNLFAKVYKPDGSSVIGNQIGVAWEFEGGFNLVLEVLPMPNNGRAEIVAFKPKS